MCVFINKNCHSSFFVVVQAISRWSWCFGRPLNARTSNKQTRAKESLSKSTQNHKSKSVLDLFLKPWNETKYPSAAWKSSKSAKLLLQNYKRRRCWFGFTTPNVLYIGKSFLIMVLAYYPVRVCSSGTSNFKMVMMFWKTTQCQNIVPHDQNVSDQ